MGGGKKRTKQILEQERNPLEGVNGDNKEFSEHKDKSINVIQSK